MRVIIFLFNKVGKNKLVYLGTIIVFIKIMLRVPCKWCLPRRGQVLELKVFRVIYHIQVAINFPFFNYTVNYHTIGMGFPMFSNCRSLFGGTRDYNLIVPVGVAMPISTVSFRLLVFAVISQHANWFRTSVITPMLCPSRSSRKVWQPLKHFKLMSFRCGSWKQAISICSL